MSRARALASHRPSILGLVPALLAAVVLGVLTLTPPALASVDKQHADAYWAKLRLYYKDTSRLLDRYTLYEDEYKAWSETVREAKDAVAEDPDDPIAREQLVQAYEDCENLSRYHSDTVQPLVRPFFKDVAAFKSAVRWFSSAGDRKRFTKARAGFEAGLTEVDASLKDLAAAFVALSVGDTASGDKLAAAAGGRYRTAAASTGRSFHSLKLLER